MPFEQALSSAEQGWWCHHLRPIFGNKTFPPPILWTLWVEVITFTIGNLEVIKNIEFFASELQGTWHSLAERDTIIYIDSIIIILLNVNQAWRPKGLQTLQSDGNLAHCLERLQHGLVWSIFHQAGDVQGTTSLTWLCAKSGPFWFSCGAASCFGLGLQLTCRQKYCFKGHFKDFT